MSVKLPPQSSHLPPASTSTAHVHPHAHGGKKGVRGKGAQPGELVHEESYSDKAEEPSAKRADGRPASSLGAALSQPQSGVRSRGGASMQRPVTARRESQGDGLQELKQQAAQAKHQLSSLLMRSEAGSAHGADAQHAVEGFHQKLALGAKIAGRSPQLERAQQAFQGLNTKLHVGELLAKRSPHLPAVLAAFSAFDELLSQQS